MWTEQSLFFRVIQRGKDAWNAAFFCGSCAVVRRSSLGGDRRLCDRHRHRGPAHVDPPARQGLPVGLSRRAARLRPGAGIDRALHRPAHPLGPGRDACLAPGGIADAPRPDLGAAAELPRLGADLLRRLAEGHLLPRPGGGAAHRDDAADRFECPTSCCTSCRTTCSRCGPSRRWGAGYGRTLFIEQYNMARFAAFAWATLAWVLPRRWLRFKVTAQGRAARQLGALRRAAGARAGTQRGGRSRSACLSSSGGAGCRWTD